MEKWKGKSKANPKMGSLLPPTKRSNNVQNPNKANRMDKKKEKKWSIGGFFKRISSKDYESSSGDEIIVRMKKLPERRKESPTTFGEKDPCCVVLHPLENPKDDIGRRNSNATTMESNNNMESFVERDHWCRDPWQSKSSDGSLEGANRKVRRHKIKARVEAKRDQLCGESSSDEDSHKSNNSLYKFSINEEGKHHLGSKRTRAARTERYVTRLSRDDGVNCNGTNGKIHSDGYHHRAVKETLPPVSQRPSVLTQPQRSPVENCNSIVRKTLRFFTDYNDDKAQSCEGKVRKEESKPPEPPPRDPQCRSLLYGYNSYPFDNGCQRVPPCTGQDERSNKKNLSKDTVCQTCNADGKITWCGIVTTTKPRPASLSSNNLPCETIQLKNNGYNSIPRRKNHKYSSVHRNENALPSKSYGSDCESFENHSNERNIRDAFVLRDVRNNERNSEKTGLDGKRSSENLEEALFELEAIYNSLRLGDEDLLERAERRSMEEFSHKIISEDSVKISTEDVRADTPDRIKDDMAYRRMHPKERMRRSSVCDRNSLSNISYLIASPILTRREMDYVYGGPRRKVKKDEPDATLDDVVFRSISRANNTLKIQEPQPPFGIPLGPVMTAPETNYLHTTPMKVEQPRSSYIPQVEPDLVTDDLAFRNLRKDAVARVANSRGSAETKSNSFGMKKKRAVRSLSANLYGLINQQRDDGISDGISTARQPTGNFHADNSSDICFHKYWNGGERKRRVSSDTELSDVDFYRKTENHLDVNGNRASAKVYHSKLRVYVPPSNSADNCNGDSNRLSSALRKSVDSSSQYSTTPEPSPSVDEEWRGATNLRSPRKLTEPITEQEISTYRQLCQDLENLVKLSKADEAETKFPTARQNDECERNPNKIDDYHCSDSKTDRELERSRSGLSLDNEEDATIVSRGKKDCEIIASSMNDGDGDGDGDGDDDTSDQIDLLTTGTSKTMEELENVIAPLADDTKTDCETMPSRDSGTSAIETGATNFHRYESHSNELDLSMASSFNGDRERIQGRENFSREERATSTANEGEKIDKKIRRDETQVDLIRAFQCDFVSYVTNRITAYFVVLLAAFLASLIALSIAS